MNFEYEILDDSDLIKKPYLQAHTKKGNNHLILLHNNINKVVDMLKDYAYVELTKVVPFGKGAEELVIVDDNGNSISKKIKMIINNEEGEKRFFVDENSDFINKIKELINNQIV